MNSTAITNFLRTFSSSKQYPVIHFVCKLDCTIFFILNTLRHMSYGTMVMISHINYPIKLCMFPPFLIPGFTPGV